MLKAVFATDTKGGMGLNGYLPWPKNSKDMEYFRKLTHSHAVIMGRATYATLPTLPYRIPVVVTSKQIPNTFCLHTKEYIDNLKELSKTWKGKDLVLIGGAKLLSLDAIKLCKEIWHTEFKQEYQADTFIQEDSMEYVRSLPSSIEYEDDNIVIRKYLNEQLPQLT